MTTHTWRDAGPSGATKAHIKFIRNRRIKKEGRQHAQLDLQHHPSQFKANHSQMNVSGPSINYRYVIYIYQAYSSPYSSSPVNDEFLG